MLNQKGKTIVKQLALQHGLDFQGLDDNGILHYALTNKSRLKAFKSFLRKYKLHYRAERTKESEESGIHTMKIRTDRDHKLLKLMRNKSKINKENPTKKIHPKKNIVKPKPFMMMMSGLKTASDQTDIRKVMLFNSAIWSRLEDEGFTPLLHSTIPPLLALKDVAAECSWFFTQLHETELAAKYKKLIELIDSNLGILSAKIKDAENPKSLEQDLYLVREEAASLLGLLRTLCASFVTQLVTTTNRPVVAFIQDLTPFWGDISALWADYKIVHGSDWLDFYNLAVPKLSSLAEAIDYVKKAAKNKLITIGDLLRKNSYYRMAEDLKSLTDDVTEDELSKGQVPAFSSTQNNWYVCKDDCPNVALPSQYTLVNDKFAYCKLSTSEKKCPSYNGVRGAAVLCADAGVYKMGAYFSTIGQVKDPELLDQLTAIAKEDGNVLLVFKKAEALDGNLYYAKIADDRIHMFLDSYPSSKRVSEYTYAVYYISGEAIMVTSDMVISADKSLLEELDKGTHMAKVATVKTATVLRLTFTGNATMNLDFVDHLRRLNAEKFGPNTWDIPFKVEADKDRILNDIKVDFGYPIQLLQVVESPDRSLAPWTYDIYAMTVLSKMKQVDSLSYEQALPRLAASDKLYGIAAQVEDADKYRVLAANLRVKYSYLVVPDADLVLSSDGYYSVKHAEGTCLMTESGQVGQVAGDDLISTSNGSIVNDSVAYIPSEIARGEDDGFVVKISPAAMRKLIDLFSHGVPAPEYSEFSQVIPSEEPCGCGEQEQPKKLVFKLSQPKVAGDTTKSTTVDYTGKQETVVVTPLEHLKDNLDELTTLLGGLPSRAPIKETISDLQSSAMGIPKLFQKFSTELEGILQPGEASDVKASSGLHELATMLQAYSSEFKELEDLASLLASTVKSHTEKDKSAPVKHSLPKKEKLKTPVEEEEAK